MRRFMASVSFATALLGTLALGVMSTPAPVAAASQVIHHSVPRIHGKFNSTSTNWSGYATTGGSYSDVQASWVQPTANCSSRNTAYSSFWVGIDGDGTNSVEQLGTDSDCSRGRPTYYGLV